MSTGERLDLSGWLRRTTTDEPRPPEQVELHEGLGKEVMVRPVTAIELWEACSECFLADPERYRTIYTRSLAEGGDTMKEAHREQAADRADCDDDSGRREKIS